MRRTRFALAGVFAIVFVTTGVAIGAQDNVVGQWVGTWDGAGAGNFDLTVQKKDAGFAGKVAVTTDGGNYDAELKGVTVSGQELKATYDFPLDPSAEVAIAAKFEGEKSAGTWILRPKGGGAEVASGTFTLKKK